MSDLSFSNQISEAPEVSPPLHGEFEKHRWGLAYERTLRFHLVLNLALALTATAVLKIDGPYYADGIAAGLFLCGFALSVTSSRAVRASQRRALAADPEAALLPGARNVFAFFALFFLSAACAVIWFTYIAPSDMPYSEDDGVASALLRQFA